MSYGHIDLRAAYEENKDKPLPGHEPTTVDSDAAEHPLMEQVREAEADGRYGNAFDLKWSHTSTERTTDGDSAPLADLARLGVDDDLTPDDDQGTEAPTVGADDDTGDTDAPEVRPDVADRLDTLAEEGNWGDRLALKLDALDGIEAPGLSADIDTDDTDNTDDTYGDAA